MMRYSQRHTSGRQRGNVSQGAREVKGGGTAEIQSHVSHSALVTISHTCCHEDCSAMGQGEGLSPLAHPRPGGLRQLPPPFTRLGNVESI